MYTSHVIYHSTSIAVVQYPILLCRFRVVMMSCLPGLSSL